MIINIIILIIIVWLFDSECESRDSSSLPPVGDGEEVQDRM